MTKASALPLHRRARYSWTLSLALSVCGCASSSDFDAAPLRAKKEAIIGGTATSNAVWPWSVRILLNNGFKCGGSMIAPDWVLTAAHCLTDGPPTSYSVELGSGEVIAASTLLGHPAYVDDMAVTGHFDMGLIRLETPATSSDTVDFIRPALGDDEAGPTAVAIGWGMTNHNTNSYVLPSQLQQVSLPIVPNASCNNVLPSRHVVYPDELCAGVANGQRGVCFGDSGSALMIQRDSGDWEHIGVPTGVTINSNGIGCQSYALFGRTSAMLDWVRENVPDAAWFSGFNLVIL